ncbi:DUF4157 domain-containing protein [Phormidium sp. LEGE 05292]|nr:DUF4157 domain-containing protein [Phormidium sp. LEGE 05292]
MSVGAPGDKYEQEADSMASKVMTMPAPEKEEPIQREVLPEEKKEEEVQTKPLTATISPLVQRETAPEEAKEEEEVQTKALSNPTIQRETTPEEPQEEEDLPVQAKAESEGKSSHNSNLESQLNGSKGGGSPLPDEVRAFMEPRFGADFSGVRVHTDGAAVQMNKELGAQAFAHGSDVYYGAGKSPGKNELTAHELTHVVQQTGGVQSKYSADEERSLQRSFDVSSASRVIQRDGEDGNLDGGYSRAERSDLDGGLTPNPNAKSTRWSVSSGISLGASIGPAGGQGLLLNLKNLNNGYSYPLTFMSAGLGGGLKGGFSIATPSETEFTTPLIGVDDFSCFGSLKTIDLTPGIGASEAFINLWGVNTSPNQIDIGGMQVGVSAGGGGFIGRFSAWKSFGKPS